MPQKPEKGVAVVHTSKVILTMPDPDKYINFLAKASRSGGSLRMTIPSDVVELLAIREDDYLEVLMTKRKKQKIETNFTEGFTSETSNEN